MMDLPLSWDREQLGALFPENSSTHIKYDSGYYTPPPRKNLSPVLPCSGTLIAESVRETFGVDSESVVEDPAMCDEGGWVQGTIPVVSDGLLTAFFKSVSKFMTCGRGGI